MPIAYLDLARVLETVPDPVRFILPGLAAGSVGAIVGQGESGKSQLALQFCMQVASGRLGITGFPAVAGKAVYLSGEDPEPILHGRLTAIQKAFRLDASIRRKLQDNLAVAAIESLNVMSRAGMADIREAAIGRDLLVLDTLSKFHELDENSTREMNAVMKVLATLARETGCAIVYVHHLSKAAILTGKTDAAESVKGSMVLTDHARWVMAVSRMTAKDAESFGIAHGWETHSHASVVKANYGGKPFPAWYRRADDGVLVPEKLAKKAAGQAKTAVSTPQRTPSRRGRVYDEI